MPYSRKEPLDRVLIISNLPEGIYKILWKDAGCNPCWWSQDEMEDDGVCFSWWMEKETIEGQISLFDRIEWLGEKDIG